MRKFLLSLGAITVIGAGGLFAGNAYAPCSPAITRLHALAGLPSAACRAAEQASAPAAQPVEEARAPAPAVTVQIAARQAFTDRLFVSGTIVAREEAMVGSPLDGLRLTEIRAEEGDRVAKGQVLARLDRSQLDALMAQNDAATQRSDAAIAQAQSQIGQYQATLTQADADMERSKKLGAQIVAESTMDQRTAAQRIAQSQLAAGSSALKVAQADKASRAAERRELMVRIDRTDITAPVAGIVSRRTARLGAVTSGAGDPLFRIIADGAVDLDAEIPEQSLARFKVGLPAAIRLAGQEKDVAGSVRLIAQEVDKATRLGKVRIALAPESGARTGAFASGEVALGSSEGVGVPASAILRDASGAHVLVVNDGVVEDRKVTLGIAEGDMVELSQGVAVSEAVVARAASFLRPGDRVRPLASSAAAMNDSGAAK